MHGYGTRVRRGRRSDISKHISNACEGVALIVADGGQGQCWCQIACEGLHCFRGCVAGGQHGESDMLQEPRSGIGNLLKRCLFDVYAVAPIVVFCWAKVPGAYCMRIPCAVDDADFLVDHDAANYRREQGVCNCSQALQVVAPGRRGAD